MATFKELMDDHNVLAVRRALWALSDDHVDLPPVVEGARGPWCVTHFYDGLTSEPRMVLAIEFDRTSDDWEPYVKAADQGDTKP